MATFVSIVLNLMIKIFILSRSALNFSYFYKAILTRILLLCKIESPLRFTGSCHKSNTKIKSCDIFCYKNNNKSLSDKTKEIPYGHPVLSESLCIKNA